MLATLPRSGAEPGADELAIREIGDEHAERRVHEALYALKPSDAALIVLTTFEHYSPSEAAEVLGITAEAARTRLHRARTRMAVVLEATKGECQ
jgi:RNA polymerase sigma factor (sigma-70 family)